MISSWVATTAIWQSAGWTMLHFLWIGGLFAAAVASFERVVRNWDANIRYLFAITQLLILALIPCCLFIWRLSNPIDRGHAELSSPSPMIQVSGTSPLAVVTPIETSEDSLAHQASSRDFLDANEELATSNDPGQSLFQFHTMPSVELNRENPKVRSRVEPATSGLANMLSGMTIWLMTVLPWVWLVGFPFTCGMLLMGISGAERFRRRCQMLEASHPAVVICRQLQEKLKLKTQVVIGVAEGISAPILIGIMRPLILFPASALMRMSPDHLEMVLLHELAHIRRWDNLVNLIQRGIEAVLFFHPGIWWLSNRVRLEREHCCDAAVLAHGQAPQTYAEMLVQIAFSNPSSEWVLGSSVANQLIPRVRRILKQEEDRMLVSRKVIVAWLMVMLSLSIATVVNAQRDSEKQDQKQAAADADSNPAKHNAAGDPDQAPADTDDKLYKVQEPLDPSKRSNALSIKGTVLKEDGQPARWSQVWLTGMVNLPSGRYRATQLTFVRADKDGQFEFWHPGWREENPQADEHAILWVIARTRDHRLTASVTLNLTREYRNKKDIHGLVLKEAAKANYSGRVVDENSSAIPKSKIQPMFLVFPVRPNDPQRTVIALTPELSDEYSAVTDADGKFTLVGLPTSTKILAKLVTPDSVGRELQWGTEAEPEISIQPGGTIRGQITNIPANDFSEQVELFIRSMSGGDADVVEPRFTFEARFSPQEDGTFEISDVPPGNYELQIAAKRKDISIPSVLQIPVRCESKSGRVTDGVQIALPNLIVGHGRVVDDQNGAPVEGAVVFIYEQKERAGVYAGIVTTDSKGEYRAYLQAGKLAIEPGKAPQDFLPPLDDVQSPAIEYTKDFEAPTLKFQRAATLRGRVVDTEGRPVAGADVKTILPHRHGQPLFPKITTDEQGRFEISQIDPQEKLPIRVRNAQGVSTAIVIDENELADPPAIVVSPDNVFRLKGTLTSQRGKPIANAAISIHWHRRLVSKKTTTAGYGGEIEKVTTNAEGQFESSPLWGGDKYHVAIEAEGYSKTDLPIVEGELARTHDYGTVQLKGMGQTVFGKVIDSGGKPIPHVTVSNSGDAVDVVATATDDLGRFQITGLLNDPVYVIAEHFKYRIAGTYVANTENEVVLKLTSRAEPPVQRPPLDLEKLDLARQQSADQLAEWIKVRELSYRPNLRDYKFNQMAITDPDEALKEIAKQSKAMDYRSAMVIARDLTASTPRKANGTDNDADKTKVALKFVEHAASLIGELGPERQPYSKFETGLLFLRLGDTEHGKPLMEAAAKDFADVKNPNDYMRANIAQGIARYDIPRALEFRDAVSEEHQKAAIRTAVIVEVSRYDAPRAIELLNDSGMKPNQEFFDDQLKFELAHWIGLVDPPAAKKIVDDIVLPRQKAEASGRAAVAISDQNLELAHSLIDQGFELLRGNRTSSVDTFYYEWLPSVAANLTVQAAQVNYPDMESLIQKTLSLRIPVTKGNSSVGRLQSIVNTAMYLAFVDPMVAKRLLADIEPELSDKMLGVGGVESVGRQQWLFAWVLADPEKAVSLLKNEMEKPREKDKSPYWTDGAYTLLALPKSAQLDFVQKYGNAGLMISNYD